MLIKLEQKIVRYFANQLHEPSPSPFIRWVPRACIASWCPGSCCQIEVVVYADATAALLSLVLLSPELFMPMIPTRHVRQISQKRSRLPRQ